MVQAEDTSDQAPDLGWTRGRVVFLLVSSLCALGIVLWSGSVMLPFILAVIIAFVLTPLVQLCEGLRIPRVVSILLVYAVTGGAVYAGLALVAPRLVEEVITLGKETPALARTLSQDYGPIVDEKVSWLTELLGPSPETAHEGPEPAFSLDPGVGGVVDVEVLSGLDIKREAEGHWRVSPVREGSKFHLADLISQSTEDTLGYLRKNAFGVVKLGHAIVAGITRFVFLLFMTLMVAGYLMHTRESVIAFFRSLPPPSAREGFDRFLARLEQGLSGVVRGQLLICLVNGVLSAIGFWFLGLKYWPLLALVAAVMSIIPIFGSILSTVPAVLIGLTQDVWTAIWVLVWILLIHQVEANLLNPKIIGVAAKIHPVLVVFALITGEHVFGLWGALLAVPALSVLQSVFQHFRYESLPEAGDGPSPRGASSGPQVHAEGG